ncbi:ATP-binding protein [Streptomyces rubiginosohelvolus]|uniref:ATP-binding protein n=1 Tax=Streptomyces rubiginosohelvolus TaxID=67362 RepID=UPI0035DD878F
MGKVKNQGSRKKVKRASSPRNVVTIERVLGAANFGGGHDEEPVHIQTSVRAAQLPAKDPEFTGRQRETSQICEELANGGSVALFGSPGVGKTALAIHVAHNLIATFPDAQLYVNLNGDEGRNADIDRVLESFLRALGFAGNEIAKDLSEKISQYRSALYGRRCIVVVDNAINEGQIRDLLPGAQNSVLIATSRHSLGGLAGVRRHRIDTLRTSDSVSLLTEVVGIDRVNKEKGAAEEISALCGGLPLALRITSNRLRDRPHWGLSYYADKLRNEQHRLGFLRSGDLEVRASFALSYAELDEIEKKTFRLLGVTSAAGLGVRLVSNLLQVGEADAEAMLESLAERSLLQLAPAPGRYQMHDLMRVFALERLQEEEGPQVVAHLLESLALWYGTMAEKADLAIFGENENANGLEFPSPEAATDWLESEHLALVDAVRAAYERQLYGAVIRISSSLARFFERRLHGNSWKKVADYHLESARALEEKEEIVYAIVGYVRMSEKVTSEEGATVALLDEAYELAKGLGSRTHEAAVLYHVGCAAHEKKKYDEARRILSRSAELAKKSKSHHQQGNALLALSDTFLELGEYSEAAECCEKARLIFLIQRDRHCQGNSWSRLGWVNLKQGKSDEAAECFGTAARKYGEVYDLHCAGMAGLNASKALFESGDFINSRIMCQAAYEKFSRINDLSCGCRALARLARLDRLAGEHEMAIEKYKRVCVILRAHGSKRELAQNLKFLGEAVIEFSGHQAAHPYLEEAIATASGIDGKLVAQIRKSLGVDSSVSLPSAE